MHLMNNLHSVIHWWWSLMLFMSLILITLQTLYSIHYFCLNINIIISYHQMYVVLNILNHLVQALLLWLPVRAWLRIWLWRLITFHASVMLAHPLRCGIRPCVSLLVEIVLTVCHSYLLGALAFRYSIRTLFWVTFGELLSVLKQVYMTLGGW
jgi:hypothetical protein